MSRESNRQSMPTVAEIVDDYRRQGFDVKVVYAAERGKVLGTPTEDENAYSLGPLRFKQTTVNKASK